MTTVHGTANFPGYSAASVNANANGNVNGSMKSPVGVPFSTAGMSAPVGMTASNTNPAAATTNQQSPFSGFGYSNTANPASTTTPTGTMASASAMSISNVVANDILQQTEPRVTAAKFIDRCEERDARFPDLDGLIWQYGLGSDSSSGYMYAPQSASLGAFEPFVLHERFGLPDEIYDAYNTTECSTDMGLFAEIGRVWVAVDNRLYFWSYRQGFNGEFQSLEDIPHTIVHVSLVKPRTDVFQEFITHVLVICTPAQIKLIGVSYDERSDNISLYDAEMSVSIDGLDVRTVRATDSGRIFFSGAADGTNVWELVYSNSESWFKSRCSKVCHTRQGVLSALKPVSVPIPGWSNKHPESLVDIVVDDSRALLYTLSTLSTIRVYFLDKGDARLCLTYKLSEILVHAQMAVKTSTPLNRNVKIASLHPVSLTHSAEVHLIALTSTGARLYIKARSNTAALRRPVAPSTIQVMNIRFPPSGVDTVMGEVTAKSHVISPGHLFCVAKEAILQPQSNQPLSQAKDVKKEAVPTGHKVLICALDPSRVLNSSSPIETACFLNIDGFVQQVTSLTAPFKASNTPVGFANESAAQFTKSPQQVAILTNCALYVFVRRFPTETFTALGNHPAPFLPAYGRIETCCVALAVAASSKKNVSLEIRQTAIRAYNQAGSLPYPALDNSSNLFGRLDVSSMNGTTGSISTSANNTNSTNLVVKLSGRFEGLAVYIARVVRDIWTSKLFDQRKSVPVINIGRASLEHAQLALIDLQKFVAQQRSFILGLELGDTSGTPSAPNSSIVPSLPGAGIINPYTENLCIQVESQSLHALMKLVDSMTEGVAFLMLLSDEVGTELDELMEYLDSENFSAVMKCDFREFVSSESGTILAKLLVKCLLHRSIARGGSVDVMARVLQERCPSYCSGADVIVNKGLEHLARARNITTDPELKAQHLRDSLDMFKKAAGYITFASVDEAMQGYCQVDFFAGAVQVALYGAETVDPSQLAQGYVREGRQANDAKKAYYDKRLQYYERIFQVLVLAETKPAYAPAHNWLSASEVCLESSDEAFHYALYDWYFQQNWQHRLLSIKSPFILRYLQISATASMEHANLLWMWYHRHDDLATAAQTLYDLALGDFELSLDDRLQLLTRASTYCKTLPPTVVGMLTRQIDANLDVGGVQADIIVAIVDDDRFSPEKREEALKKLDGKPMTISNLFNDYADPLGYHEICLTIFYLSEFRGVSEVLDCWDKLIHSKSNYDEVSDAVQRMGLRFSFADTVFPLDKLIHMLEQYALEQETPAGWIVDTFLQCRPNDYQSLWIVFDDLLERKDFPFNETTAYKRLAVDSAYLLVQWGRDGMPRGYVSQAQIARMRDYLDAAEYAKCERLI